MATVRIDNFTDPACPFAWSAEPARRRLRWLYGNQLDWVPRMVVLSERVEDYTAKGFTPEMQARGMTMLARRHGMPMDTSERPRLTATVDACRTVVAARVHEGDEAAEAVLRRLRVHQMGGDLIDEQPVIDAAVREAGLDPDRLWGQTKEAGVEAALRQDMHEARTPLPAARALDHKLAGPPHERRYTCPSLVFTVEGRDPLVAAGFQPIAAYEVLLANVAPDLERRPDPESVDEVLAWACEPLAAAEIAAVLDRPLEDVEAELTGVGAGRVLRFERRFERDADRTATTTR